jgi:hypothetical protein
LAVCSSTKATARGLAAPAGVLPLELQENRFAKGIARIYRDLGEMKDAQKYGMEAVYINPYDPTRTSCSCNCARRPSIRKALRAKTRDGEARRAEERTEACQRH